MKHIKCVLSTLLSSALVLGLCGCSLFGAPVNTEELLVRYVSNKNVDNFSAKVNVDMSVSALGVRAVIPITTNVRVANNATHGTIEVDLSALDTRNYDMEFYTELLDDALNVYIGIPHGNETTWKYWRVDTTSKVDIATVTDLLSASEFTKIATDSDPQICYELTVPIATVLKTVFGVTAGSAEVGGMNERGMLDAVGNDKVRVGFTKDCLLRSIATGALLTFKSAETNNVTVRVGIDVGATFDEYGGVDLAKVAVPNEVREAATRTNEPVDVGEVIGEGTALSGAVAS